LRRLFSLAVFGGLVAFPALPSYAALADADGDLVSDDADLCPAVADPFQGDIDNDGIGDLCDTATSGVTSFAGTAASEVVLGTSGADTLAGADGRDALYGEGGDDTLDGGDGRDFLAGGPGNDTLTGGASCDVFAFDPSGDGDTITDFNPQVDRLSFPAQDDDASDDAPPPATYSGDDHLEVSFVTDGGATATLELEGLAPGVEIALITGPCESLQSEPPLVFVPGGLINPPPFQCSPLLTGPAADDFLGTPFPLDGVFFNGTAGNETIFGTQCSDLISGDGGVEIVPDDGEPQVVEPGECATDYCTDDVIYGFGGNDIIIGDSPFLDGADVGGDDRIFAGDGDDLVAGDGVEIDGCGCAEGQGPIGGDDVIFGENGDDILIGDALDVIFGDAAGGDDFIDGGAGDDFIVGDAFFGVEFGAGGGDDVLVGGAGDDIIFGDSAFLLDGFGGDDIIVGGAGDDILFGDAPLITVAAGSDTFVFDTSSNFGNDVIVDVAFAEQIDTIQFSGAGLTTLADLNARSTFTDDGIDILAVVFTDPTKVTQVGSVLIADMGTFSVASWDDVNALLPLDVIIVP
jgi:Ca2+-binding RTX toxin-like protein